MEKKIRTELQKCEVCAKVEPNNKPIVQPLQLYKIDASPFSVIHTDFAGPMVTIGNPTGIKYLMLVTCRFTHWVELYPLQEITGDTLLKTFIEEFIPTHGLPRRIVSDRGSQFSSEKLRNTC